MVPPTGESDRDSASGGSRLTVIVDELKKLFHLPNSSMGEALLDFWE